MTWLIFEKQRYELKRRIKINKRYFNKLALALKRPNEVCSTISEFLNPIPATINADVNMLIRHFSTAKRVCFLARKAIPPIRRLATTFLWSTLKCVSTTSYHQYINQSKNIQWKGFSEKSDSIIMSPKEPGDFRPISILPILSVYELLVMKQMVSFLETDQFYYRRTSPVSGKESVQQQYNKTISSK